MGVPAPAGCLYGRLHPLHLVAMESLRKLPYRHKRRGQGITGSIGITFHPDALARLDFQCQLTQESRGKVLSDLILTGLPPVPEPVGGAV